MKCCSPPRPKPPIQLQLALSVMLGSSSGVQLANIAFRAGDSGKFFFWESVNIVFMFFCSRLLVSKFWLMFDF